MEQSLEQNVETSKLSRKKILSVMLVIIVIILLFFAWVIFKHGGATKNLFTCAKEGGTIGTSEMPSKCCAGLKAVSGIGGFTGDCSSSYAPPGGLSTCSNCGDGICNSSVSEDKCNCPEDCATKEGTSLEKCAGAGQAIDEEKKKCCPSLKAINPYVSPENCPKNSEDIASNAIVCSLCGNGICAGIENKCNCPEDCK